MSFLLSSADLCILYGANVCDQKKLQITVKIGQKLSRINFCGGSQIEITGILPKRARVRIPSSKEFLSTFTILPSYYDVMHINNAIFYLVFEYKFSQ